MLYEAVNNTHFKDRCYTNGNSGSCPEYVFSAEIANYAAELYPDRAYLKDLVFINLYTTAIPFYLALYQTLQLLSYIDMDKAFSELSVKALKNIKHCAFAISILYVTGLPLFGLLGEADDAPGVVLIGKVMIFASMAVAVFAAVLQKLLEEAIDIKTENALTV